VANGIVYSALPDLILAFDALSGVQRWRVSLPIYNTLSPGFADDRIFVAGATNTLFALNATTGVALWNSSNMCPVHLWSIPTVAKGTVFVGSDVSGRLHVLDARTGERLWNFTSPDAVRSPVVVGGLVYFGVNSPWDGGDKDQLFAVVAF